MAAALGLLTAVVIAAPLHSQEAEPAPPAAIEDFGALDEPLPEPPRLPPPKNATKLVKDERFRAWVDREKGVVLIDGQVSLRAGALEMFACTRNTKEHESIVAVDTQAFPIHAALLALGAEPGGPVQFEPQFVPPAGTEIDIRVQWRGPDGRIKTVRAQDWIRDFKTGKSMPHPFVFAGSLFFTDPDTGRQYYQAEGGDFICVSNFATAMLDIPVESTQANEGLFYEAFTDHIPPLGTPVRLVLKPVLKKSEDAEQAAKLPAETLARPQADGTR